MITTLTVSNISKSFEGSTVLKDFSLTLKSNEIIALVGDSGCGKTTLLRIVAGLETPDSGVIKVSDKEITMLPAEKRNIGLVFQDFALFPHMSVKENILYGLHRLPRSERSKRVMEVMELANIEELFKRYPHQLSGGQQQRVALARALAPEPALILLDEPFSNLDSALRGKLRSSISKILKESNTPAIIVTHDETDVNEVADRAIFMETFSEVD